MSVPLCRGCGSPLALELADLGSSPLANSYLEPEALAAPEPFLPLCVYVCASCWLAQLPECATPESIFSDYSYFSSYSDTWLAHARDYVAMACARFDLGTASRVVEIASNDGYLLRWFVERNVPVLGVEPARNVARAAEELGIPTLVRFFGTTLAQELCAAGRQADLLLGNNVLAHTPALNDFVAGMKILLSPQGAITMEFPHLVRLVEGNQFDTIYHEHFSYFSLVAVERVFARHELELFDVEELATHGGSLRIYAQHAGSGAHAISPRVAELAARERAVGVESPGYYDSFAEQVRETKRGLLEFLIRAKREGRSVVGYGAPAKGNTLLNYCGVRTDFLDYTVDRSPHKQGRFLPGTRIPIHGPERIFATHPDYVLVLPWNLRDEIATQMAAVREWGGRFVVAVPRVEVF